MEKEPNEKEQEQSPTEIARVLIDAVETQRSVLLTQITENGTEITNIVTPISIEGSFITVDSEGFGLDIELNKILKAKIIG